MATQPIPVVEKTIQMLILLGEKENGVSPSEICEKTGMAPATCYRALQTCMNVNWIAKKSGGKYVLGFGMALTAQGLMRPLTQLEILQQPLDELTKKSRLSGKISVRNGNREFMTLLSADAPGPIALVSKPGSRFPVIEGSAGAVLLHAENDTAIEKLIAATTDSCFEKKNPELVRDRIRQCREQGCCFLHADKKSGHLETISAPIRDCRGQIVAALTLLGFPTDFTDREKELIRLILSGARICEHELHQLTEQFDKQEATGGVTPRLVI